MPSDPDNSHRSGRRSGAPRYFIRTYGCQMNVHDSEIYAGLLADMGYEEASRPEDADVILVNTCSVRERAEDKLFSELGRLRLLQAQDTCGAAPAGRANGKPIVGVTGCIAQQRGGDILERAGHVDFVIGTRAIHGLPEVLDRVRNGAGQQVLTEDRVEFEAPGALRGDRIRAFVTIMEGCNNYCSFCIVPTTRGLEIYRSAEAILDEVRGLSIRGYREVTLLGQNVNSWVDPETGISFPQLLVELDRALREDGSEGGVERIRFLTSHPKDLSDGLIDAMAACPKLAKHLHLPVQSGANEVLHRMNRHYTADRYRRQVEQLRAAVPGIGLSTDLIVGFPGESDAQFRETLDLVREIEYDSFYSFEYSPRPDTAATLYDDDVAPEVKRQRLLELQALGREIQSRHNAALVGSELEVLIDGTSKRSPDDVSGRTSSNHIVNAPGSPDLIGSLVTARIVGHGPHSLQGLVASPPR